MSTLATIREATTQILDEMDPGLGPGVWCATIVDTGDQDRWVQVQTDSFNAAYPHTQEPMDAASRLGLVLPSGTQFLCWEANKYVTFAFPSSAGRAVAEIADGYFKRVLGCGAGYEVDVEIEDLGEPAS